MHQYNGQEAVAVGVCENLRPTDYITSTHRGHGHYIAKGGNLNAMMAEMFGKATGCCKGMGGSMHLMDFRAGILGATGIVGAGIPIAVGAALSAKLRGTDQVVACFFGDGAANTGAFHEALNLASVWELPVVFVCENNFYGFSTHVEATMKIREIALRASAYGMPGKSVEGNDIIAVCSEAKEAVERSRMGKGPTLLECKTYRFKGHSRFEPAKYRPREELEEWLKRDPIPITRKFLLEKGIAKEDELAFIEQDAARLVDEAVAFARSSPEPEPDIAVRLTFSRSASDEANP